MNNNLQNKLEEGPKVHQSFEVTFVRVLDTHAHTKKINLYVVIINHVEKNLPKAIMKRSALKRNRSRKKQQKDVTKYNKQQYWL